MVDDAFPPGTEVIEIHVQDLKQLFNSIDPSPFRERDLDPKAEEFIVHWARELPREAPLGLVIYIDHPPEFGDAETVVRDAIREFFSYSAQTSRQSMRQLLRVGRTSLVIGVACLALFLVVGDQLAKAIGESRLASVVRESLTIGGWVAMWRPMEIFLYDWWPIRAETRLYERLSAMPVRIASAKSAR